METTGGTIGDLIATGEQIRKIHRSKVIVAEINVKSFNCFEFLGRTGIAWNQRCIEVNGEHEVTENEAILRPWKLALKAWNPPQILALSFS